MDGDTYICIKQFNARLGDELSLKIGDKIQVLADDREYNDGWYMGKNLLTGEAGLYPKTFTQLISNQDSKPILRSRSRRMMAPTSSTSSANPPGDAAGAKNLTVPAVPSSLNPSSSDVNKLDESVSQLSINKDAPPVTTKNLNNELDKVMKELDDTKGAAPKQSSTAAAAATTDNNHTRSTSVQSLTEDLNPLQAHTWTPKQVSSYFALVLGFDMDVAGKFAKHKITGAILFELDLGHLKELDIDSFGTRFEIHKEIEKLKDMSNRSAKMKQSRTNSQSTGSTNKNDSNSSGVNTPPTASTTLPDNVPLFGEEKKELEDEQTSLMPSAVLNDTSTFKYHQRKRSQSLDNISPYVAQDGTFMSPRKAPQPPNPDSPMNANYRFGDGSEYGQPPSHYGLYMTRTNASSQALGGGGASRPASSIYEQFSNHNRNGSQASNRHRRNQSGTNHHRRHSSMLSFLSSGNDDSSKPTPQLQLSGGKFPKGDDKLISPAQIKRDTLGSQASPTEKRKSQIFDLSNSPVDIDDANLSPKKLNSVSGRTKSMDILRDERRSTSDSTALSQSRPNASRLKSLRATSTQNFRSLTGSKKLKTSAFQEGIREITPDEAIKSANYSGYMSKRSSNTLAWRTRYFTLHGTRLSYYHSLKDKKEKGLIDITAHKVIPINSEADEIEKSDKYAAMYASTTFAGNYCFKLVPPAPGFKKGLTFTQPKTHYFAVESAEEMRGWVKALMQATIDIDDSVPVVSSCSTPTVSLSKAQELLAKAREETKLRDDELRANGYLRDDFHNDTSFQSSNYDSSNAANESTLTDTSPLPKLSIDTDLKGNNTTTMPTTPQIPRSSSQSGGFVSPYLLASGLLSPKSGNGSSPNGTPNTTSTSYFADATYSGFKPPSRQSSHANGSGSDSRKSSQQYLNGTGSANNSNGNVNIGSAGDINSGGLSSTPYSTASGSSNNSSLNVSSPKEESKTMFKNSTGRLLSGSRKLDKMMAFSSDSSGNHTFVIKSKK
ncbi:Protein BOI2 [Candida viswanathii]|uniref:Protein BOI2 n=1 Tax=Candida viswanathii TaxID=5486 RepID=A0A367YAM5_9ASCO|nr:Protein BOI2 [Candida viswanathii]